MKKSEARRQAHQAIQQMPDLSEANKAALLSMFEKVFDVGTAMLPGAYTKWNAMRLFYLWWDVQVLQMEKRHSENNICEKFLPKHPEWKKWKGATLLRQYRASKHSPMVQMADKVIAQLGWDAFRDASVGLTTPKTRAEIFDHLSKVEKLERFPTLR